jgi:uncharacterized protein YozE (UPF0346 family)
MRDARLLDISFASLEKLKLDDFKSISEYLNAHTPYSKDIKIAGDFYSKLR